MNDVAAIWLWNQDQWKWCDRRRRQKAALFAAPRSIYLCSKWRLLNSRRHGEFLLLPINRWCPPTPSSLSAPPAISAILRFHNNRLQADGRQLEGWGGVSRQSGAKPSLTHTHIYTRTPQAGVLSVCHVLQVCVCVCVCSMLLGHSCVYTVTGGGSSSKTNKIRLKTVTYSVTACDSGMCVAKDWPRW